MAIKGPILMNHDDVFPHGCFIVGEVQPMRDFDHSTKDNAVQAVDRGTGLPVWTVDVVDADPSIQDRLERTLRVRLVAPVQPVPPATTEGVPFTQVEFDGLSATPYVATSATGRGRLSWSLRATGMRTPRRAPAGASNGKAS
jgi:hypothetical protein